MATKTRREVLKVMETDKVIVPITGRRCGTCRWFADMERADERGECRLMPPERDQDTGFGMWPVVHRLLGWCGEYEQML